MSNEARGDSPPGTEDHPPNVSHEAAMPPPMEVNPEPVGSVIEINGNILEPDSQMPGGDCFEETASKTNYILIQFTEFPTFDQGKVLESFGVEFCRSIPPCTWLVKFTPHDLTPLRELPFVVFANPYHESLSLKPELEKLLTRKKKHAFAGPTAIGAASASSILRTDNLLEVSISLHPFSRLPSEFRDYLVSSHSIAREKIFLDLTGVRTSLTPEQILRISKVDDVAEVHLAPELKPSIHLVRGVIKTPQAISAFKEKYPNLELDGSEQVIAITDSGLDNWGIPKDPSDKSDPTHPFFQKRIIHLDLRSQAAEGIWFDGKKITRKDMPQDFQGHGTMVAGVALGSYDQIASQEEMGLVGPRLDGVAPKAQLIMQNVWGLPVFDLSDPLKPKPVSAGKPEFGNTDLAYHTLFLDPYHGYPTRYSLQDSKNPMTIVPSGDRRLHPAKRARIHNTSLGEQEMVESDSGYAPAGKWVDEAAYIVPDHLMIFPAGNYGDDAQALKNSPVSQIWGFASAKNVLTVGACFNGQHVNTKNDPDQTSEHPMLWSKFQTSENGGEDVSALNIPRMSSRGPPKGFPTGTPAIIKPDVVAPGVAIYTSASRNTMIPIHRTAGKAPKHVEIAGFATGTSLSSPVVAGAAALLRQALTKRLDFEGEPSSALLKALIVQGALDLSTQGGKVWAGNTKEAGGSGLTASEPIAPAPNYVQGWGRLDIEESIKLVTDQTHCFIHDAKRPASSTDPDPRVNWRSRQVSPKKFPAPIPKPSGRHPRNLTHKGNIKATLCWTDPPAETLQNRLFLSILYKDGRPGGVSADPNGTGIYRLMAWNNVQRLEINDIDLGFKGVEMVVKITAGDLVKDPIRKEENQAYALVWKTWYTIVESSDGGSREKECIIC